MDNLKDATSGAGTVIPLGTPLFKLVFVILLFYFLCSEFLKCGCQCLCLFTVVLSFSVDL
jgi:hypothetical protein